MHTKENFLRLAAQGQRRIPVTRSLFADLDTPVSTYIKVGNKPYSYLLESVQGGEKWGRYSFIGLPAKRIIKVTGYQVSELVSESTDVTSARDYNYRDYKETTNTKVADPLDYVWQQCQDKSIPTFAEGMELLPRFCGGFVGYFSYECAAYAEKRLQRLLDKPDPLDCPQIVLMQSDEVIAFDNLLGKIMLICYAELPGLLSDTSPAKGAMESPHSLDASYQKAQQQLDAMEEALTRPLDTTSATHTLRAQVAANDDNLRNALSQESAAKGDGYRANVSRIKEYIRAGDAMQVVPSQRMEIDYPHDSFDFYRTLRTVNPAPYMFHLDLDDFCVAGASPEILARLEETPQGRIATLRPIAGTRPRGKTPAEDKALEQELLADPKEVAEHVMLIDLGRNDVGRIAKIGTVKVSDEFSIEKYSHVMHIVSNVTGELQDELNLMDVLRAALPAGTLSGAPKIRAMEIIDEVEPVKRGIYGGALGYLGWQGNMDLCIGIRTAVIKNNKLFVQAGGGIVADSDPDKEWQETLNKRGAILRVAGMLGLS